MKRPPITRWLILIGFLIVVGIWPAAAAPVVLAAAGLAVIFAAVPVPVLAVAAAAVAIYLKHFAPRPATT